MTFVSRASLALLFAIAPIGVAHAQDPSGLWLRDNGRSQVRVAPCGGGAFCGTVAWMKDTGGPGHVGQRVFYDMVSSGDNQWSGHAFNPEDGKSYNGTMTLSGNRLTTAGCVLGGLICKSVSWTRVK
jgi:uncharacterized protein (DUF2147 family)